MCAKYECQGAGSVQQVLALLDSVHSTHYQHESSEAEDRSENNRLPEDIGTLKLTPRRKPVGTIVLEILPEMPNGTRHRSSHRIFPNASRVIRV